MAGRDSLTVLPTGGGKSLCYQLPATLLPGTAIVVSPLISLMADQVNALQLLGVPAAYINSSQSGEEVRSTKAQFFRGELKLLYVSPERLLLDHFKEELRQVEISFFAIDEAHCISQWGHDFRPEYKQLSSLRGLFPGVAIHAFTATAPPRLQQEILSELKLVDPAHFVGSYYRPNLKYKTIRRARVNQQIQKIVAEFDRGDCGIIYCLTRRETEKIAEFLQQEGHRALAYHAGMSAQTRRTNHDRFSQEKVNIIVATVAFGMGIDQSNVRYVLHCGMPRSLSHYQQESGRAGRDGLDSQCVLIYGPKDILFWKRIIEEEDVLTNERMAQLQDMIDYASNIRCRHRTLVEHFGQAFEEEKCSNCDVCQGEVESIAEARTFSRMILSTVLKVRQAFGGAYIAQILTGSKDQKILRNGHDRLSVYNLLAKYSQYQVHDWVNQLESQGYLVRSGGQYPVFGLARSGYWLLRPDKYGKTESDLTVFLIETRKGEKKKSRAARKLETAGRLRYGPFPKIAPETHGIGHQIGRTRFPRLRRQQPPGYGPHQTHHGKGLPRCLRRGDTQAAKVRQTHAGGDPRLPGRRRTPCLLITCSQNRRSGLGENRIQLPIFLQP